MTQAIVCHNGHGLVLASDSSVLHEEQGGRVEHRAEQRLYALGSHAAILCAGGMAGVELSARLAQWMQSRDSLEFDDVLAVGRDFLAGGYARYLRTNHGRTEGQPAANRHLYFIIGGYAPSRTEAPYQAVLLQSEAGELPFQETRLGYVFTLPRRLSLEERITRQIAEGASLRGLARSCRAALVSLAQRNPESMAAPFQVAMLTAEGIAFLDDAGLPEEPDDEEEKD